VHPSFIKTQPNHYCLQRRPFNSIISLAHVKFDAHIPHFAPHPCLHGVHCFVGNKNVICNQSFVDECNLCTGNNFRQHNLQFISQNFKNQLVNNITQTDRCKFSYNTWLIYFWYEGYMSFIDPSIHHTKVEKMKDGRTYLRVHNSLIMLIKTCREAIETRRPTVIASDVMQQNSPQL
jgi:hypothetical protein